MSKQSTFLSSQEAFVIDCAVEQAQGAILDQNCLTKPIHVLRAEPKNPKNPSVGLWCYRFIQLVILPGCGYEGPGKTNS